MKRYAVVAAVLAVLALPLSASAAYEFYVNIEGTKQGRFKGECSRDAWKTSMAGLDYSHEMLSPVDPATGQASGRRQHKPIYFTKAVGAASPQLFQALTTHEVLKSVVISFVATNAEGEEEVVYTIRLVNAYVASLRTFVADADDKGPRLREEIGLTYQRIEFESRIGKTAASDDWHQ